MNENQPSKAIDQGDLEVNMEAAPWVQARPQTTRMPPAVPTITPLTLPPAIPQPTEPGWPPGGQAAVFAFADGTTVEFTLPHAIGVAGYGDSEIAVAWWTLMDPSKVILNQGPLLPMLARKARQ